MYIRSIILYLLFVPSMCITSVLFTISFALKPLGFKNNMIIINLWTRFLMYLLKKVCKITYEIRGLENLPKEPCIIACKHQSTWETMMLQYYFYNPAFIYKKELGFLPFFGWGLYLTKSIAIDRSSGVSSIKNIIKQAKGVIKNGRNIIIFPQGTRVSIGEPASKYPYKPGIVGIYSALNVPVVPVALNSGKFWPKTSFLKKPGIVIIEFLPQIRSGLSKGEFLSILEGVIEEASNKLV